MPIPAGYHEPLLTPRAARSVEAAWSFVAEAAGQTVVLPDGRCDVILRFNSGEDDPPVPILTGPATRPYAVRYVEGDTWVGLRLRPGLGGALWGGGLSAHCNDVLRGADALAALPALAKVIADTRDADALQDALLGLDVVGAAPACPAPVIRALEAMHTSGGRLSVTALAAIAGCTTRHLGRLFATFIGLPPKTYAQLVRFHRAVALLSAQTLSHVQVAMEAGYADQAHMTREVRLFSGVPPSRLPDRLDQPAFFT